MKEEIVIKEPKIPWYRRRLFWTLKERIAYDLAAIAVLVLAVYLLFHFVVGVAFVDGNSMYPTLRDGQLVFYQRLGQDYDYGDVISVRMPTGEFYVKRVIAKAGDTVELKDGKVWVNGEVAAESYAFGETVAEDGTVEYPLTVEDGKYFILGDNRENSNDSRAFGAIIEERVTGEVLFAIGKVK
ncbi:MAG: signal peptidase I [Hespellia sp.]|nr:signal peptidase I [Hespellia sp.]